MHNKDKRLYHSVSLAGPLIDQGLTAADADALLGILFFKPKALMRMLRQVNGWRQKRLLELVPDLIEHEGAFFKTIALLERWRERKKKYEFEKAEWLAADVNGGWRGMQMSAGQRYLVQSTAAFLTIEIPVGMNRGNASDWLESNMAHLVMNIDEEMEAMSDA